MDIINFRVSPLGEALEIWVEVPDGPNYVNIEIEKIAIQDQNNYTIGYPDSPQIELTIGNPIDDLNITNFKRVLKRIPLNNLGLLGLSTTGLYFMYVKQRGIPLEDTPCCCNKEVTIGSAVNLIPLYNKAIKYMNNYINNCKDGKDNIVDIYLKKNMLINALQLEDYVTAIYIFNNLLGIEFESSNCLTGCNNNSIVNINNGCTTC